MTKAYFKWDGRTGATAIIGISMIQVLIIIDVIGFATRCFYTRLEIREYTNIGKWMIAILLFGMIFYNYRKYNGTYNKFKTYWKDEDKPTRVFKGLLVIISLVIPWIPIILMGIFWK